MERTCKYLALALVLVVHCVKACLAQQETRSSIAADQSALLALRAHITADPHQFLSNNWSVSSSICEWNGVTCDLRQERVVVLSIPNMGLSGTLPPQLGNLSFLVYLDISNNSFHGALPHDLARLSRLKVLHFGKNNLNGKVPEWLGLLSELQYLSLKENHFSGLIPPSISNLSKLVILSLTNNSLEGELPSGIGNLNNLKSLAIEVNRLSGSLPLEIFNISTLETIGLSSNSLSSSLPNHICSSFQRLKWLGLSYNKFSGVIPTNLSQCIELQLLAFSGNSFSGPIPEGVGNMEMLETLYLDKNDLRGVIPKELGNLTMLKKLNLRKNNLTGPIPWEMSKLYKLEELQLEVNMLSGSIPVKIFNHSTIRQFALGDNNLSGRLPGSLGFGLPNLEGLYLSKNKFSGVIPRSILNCSKLKIIELSVNSFVGYIPESLGDLEHLEYLSLHDNILTSKSPSQEFGFLTSLTKCKNLQGLLLNDNSIEGFLPVSIGNLSNLIQRVQLQNCYIKGGIPDGIGNLSRLIDLNLSGNQLIGSIPTTIQNLKELQGLFLQNNRLSDAALENFCGLQRLTYLYLSSNKIAGSIPNCLGSISSLRYVHLGNNKLNSSIPANFWSLKDLLELNLSSNSLTGSLPEVGNLKVVDTLDLSMNCLSGEVPTTISFLQGLTHLSLAHNKLQGSIPESIGRISSLEMLDLSHNNFSGLIPRSLEMLQYLKYLNVSMNRLSGEIPSRGPFQNFTGESFILNEALCGAPRFNTPPCTSISSHRKSSNPKLKKLAFFLLGIAAIIGIIGLGLVQLIYKMDKKAPVGTNLSSTETQERISYLELLEATNGYDETNLLGIGGAGYVYRGTLSDGRIVAVKVFNLQMKGAFRSFATECQVFRSLRHRNLTKVISSYSDSDFKALVLEFMPNGSLEKWLYSHNYFLDIIQRLNIMIDVACALHYLHFSYVVPIVHCDLKPSNVLLDQDMVAHVSDFGISKFLDQEESIAWTKTLATMGYVAPEYGLQGMVSTKCDIYSYGIMLMEVFTRRKPALFGENLSFREWVSASIPNSVAQVIDTNLLNASEEDYNEKLRCVVSIFQVALICSSESSRKRGSIEEVLPALKQIKLQLLSYSRLT